MRGYTLCAESLKLPTPRCTANVRICPRVLGTQHSLGALGWPCNAHYNESPQRGKQSGRVFWQPNTKLNDKQGPNARTDGALALALLLALSHGNLTTTHPHFLRSKAPGIHPLSLVLGGRGSGHTVRRYPCYLERDAVIGSDEDSVPPCAAEIPRPLHFPIISTVCRIELDSNPDTVRKVGWANPPTVSDIFEGKNTIEDDQSGLRSVSRMKNTARLYCTLLSLF